MITPGIRFKLLFPVLMLVVLLTSTIHFYWIPHETNERIERVQREHAQHLQLVGIAITEFLLNGNLAQAYTTLQEVEERQTDWQKLCVFTHDGRRLYPLGEAPPVKDSDQLLKVETAINHLDEHLGRIEVVVDLSSALSDLDSMKQFEYLTLALLLLVGVITFFSQDQLIRKPLEKVADAAKRMAAGEFEVSLPARGSDEVGTLVGSFEDMRDHLAEQQRNLVELNAGLEERVKRRTRDLEEARDAAESATRSKSAFLAAMSHELRTPMNGVVGMVELLRETPLTDDQRKMLCTVRDSGFGLLRILDDILDFSKIEAGKLAIEDIPILVTQVLESVCETLVPNALRRQVCLELSVDPALPEQVYGDPVRWRQILYNLAGNAIKFSGNMQDRAGHVALRADRISSVDGTDLVRLQVIDNGIGIPEAVKDQLFQPFSQADDSTTRRFGGTGLGLSITRRLVEMLGGQIKVDSIEGEGSTFTVTLPLRPTEDAIDTADEDLSGLRIGVLVASEGLRDLASGYLSRWGAEVMELGVAPMPFSDDMPDVLVMDDAVDQTSLNFDAACCVTLVPRGEPDRNGLNAAGRTVETHPLLPSVLRHSLAVASGRIAAEQNHTDSVSADVSTMTEAQTEAAGKLVLVAEDNETNREVLGRQLAMLGYTAVMACDGREALEQWHKRRFGLVLTDCHMPEMDGFELTAAIRKSNTEYGRQVPIVAITANAMQGEATRCLDAGMNDYLSKPVELTKLKKTLGQWLPLVPAEPHNAPLEGSDDTAPAPEDLAAAAADETPVDLNALTALVGDDPQVHAMLLDKFAKESLHIVDEVRSALASRDAAEIGALAHKLKSSARAVGAVRLADISEQLEQAGKAGNWPEIETLVSEQYEAHTVVQTFLAEATCAGPALASAGN